MIAQLGKYRIDGVLGKGAMGVVYKAFDPGIERVVALKTMRKELFTDAEQADLTGRFKNEAQAAGRLAHPHIVTVFDYGEDDDSAWIAMEFVEGAGLDTLLTPGHPTPVARALAWMCAVLTALEHAHARGVIHRDIKPANLLITPAAHLKVTDFGIARLASSTLTQAGSIVGTPSFMAPEQFRGDAIDGRTDVFAAGIVLYQLLTGARPFSGTASVVMQQILNHEPPPPSTLLPALGTRFDAVLASALAKRADARYPSVRAFLDALLAAAPVVPRAPDADATVLAAQDLSPLAPALSAWKRAALPDIEISLAREIGPMARYLLAKLAGQADDLDHLSELLLQHIPSSFGREQFLQSLGQIRRKLDTSGTGTGSGTRSRTGLTGPRTHVTGTAGDLDEVYADTTAHKLVAIIGPIGRVVVRRAMQQTGDRQAFVQLLATHIDNQGERARFIADALA